MTTRRTVLGAALTAPLLATTPAAATGGRLTVILSPHQDDEVIRLAPYITYATDRGDTIHLIQATDGAATSVGRRLGLDPATVTTWRNREQTHSWNWLTGGRGQITRLGLPDGAATWGPIYNATRAALLEGGPGSELYVATWHHDRPDSHREDKHVDHVACVLAARQLQEEGWVVRYAAHPTATPRGSFAYRAEGRQLLRIEGAVDSYGVIGQRSAPESLKAARAGVCRVSA